MDVMSWKGLKAALKGFLLLLTTAVAILIPQSGAISDGDYVIGANAPLPLDLLTPTPEYNSGKSRPVNASYVRDR